MASHHLWHRVWESVSFRVQHALLNIYGPAQLDDAHDPRRDLERHHEAERSEAERSAGRDRDNLTRSGRTP